MAKNKGKWVSFDERLPRFEGQFAWFGYIRMKHIKTDKVLDMVHAGGCYCDSGRNMTFRIDDERFAIGTKEQNQAKADKYDITHWLEE